MAGDVRISPIALAQYVNSPTGDVARDLTKRAIRVETAVKRSLHEPGKGRVYVKSNPRRVHRASAPGAPPATDLGLLAASIKHAIGKDTVGIFAQIGTGLKKGRWLELGTRNMRPRPYLRRALKAAGR
jgi:hypothetical protein